MSPGPLAEASASSTLRAARDGEILTIRDPQSGRPAVVLTQADIRQVQLAKAAIRAGVESLLHKTGLEGGIERVLLAGAFGNTIRPGGAVRIGLLPV